MTPDRWQRLKSLFDRALEKPADARDGFLQQAAESPSVIPDSTRGPTLRKAVRFCTSI